MQNLQCHLHVSASTLTIVTLSFNLSRDYTICMVYPGGGKRNLVFNIVKQDLVPLSPEYTIHTVWSLDKLNDNETMANVEAETCR